MDTLEPTNTYLDVNKDCWNQRLESHLSSDFYDVNGFKSGKSSLNPLEMELLGNVSGKSILHLQCHFGLDSLSLARLGAKVTGVDFSEASILQARKLAKELTLDADFICSDVYQLPEVLNEQFDIVYTSYGVLGWLPSMPQWAEVAAKFLKPNGKLVVIEFHPIIWMFDSKFTKLVYPYSSKTPIYEEEEGTYAEVKAPIKTQSISWNHGVGTVIAALLKQGLHLKSFEEFDYSNYNCFPNCIEITPGKYKIQGFEDLFPLMYALTASPNPSA